MKNKKSLKIFNEEQKYISPGYQGIALYSKIVPAKAKGTIITDEDGNQYIDIVQGLGVGSIGHCHAHYIKTMQAQLENFTYSSFSTEVRLKFLKLVHSMLPKGLDQTQLFSSGAEAVEAAFRLAKSVTKKFEFISFWGGFHGKTGGVLGLLGDTFKKDLGPFMPGLYQSPYAYCYRCPLKLKYPSCGMACVDTLRDTIKYNTQHQIAAIIAEPIQGTAGNVVPPPEFLPAVQSVAKEFNALYISDEMQTGFGRSGKTWGFQHHSKIVPDILTVGKGIGGGFPLSGVIASKELCANPPYALPSGSSSSYGGNALAAAAGLATLEVIQKEKIVQNSQRVGEKMLARFKELQDQIPCIGDVRGKGLMIGIELVKDVETKERVSKKMMTWVFEECLKRGLLSMAYANPIRIVPPLNITEEEALNAANILGEVLRLACKKGLHK